MTADRLKPGTFVRDGTEAQFVPPRFKDFTVTSGPVVIGRYSGIDVTAADVVRRRAEALKEGYEEVRGEQHPLTYADRFGQEVVWDGANVVAILDACVSRDAEGPYLVVVWYAHNERLYPLRRAVGEHGWDRPEAPVDDDQDDDEEGIRAASEIATDTYQRGMPAWSITEGEVLIYHSSRKETLDEVVAEEVEHFRPGEHDKAIWRGSKLMAVVRNGPDNKPKVDHFE